ncbi:MAG: pyridoxal-phosphate dependent enzyme, partial [Candidatus Aminicenantes bacterium]|nr:pyridoxal-phosphate dependent enzyme [Candidatus Aminicenantes bacterium]
MIGSVSQANIKDECLKARQRIQKHIRYTPVEHSVYLSEKTESQVFLKLENIQITGSFKLRGAANKLLSLNNELHAKGVFTASSGNHGAAVSHMSQKLRIKAFVYLPSTTSSAKIKSLKAMGSEIKIVGDDCLKAEMAAKKEAQKRKTCFVSPYNDLKIIAGQGTVGIELMEQIPQLDAVIVPV